ncbi:hypothetical protein [Nostoc sp.]|uniref:hypothetical protein n=1 Tax=Nostoc sp. TaxID=1180 RepID=UPI002FF471B1
MPTSLYEARLGINMPLTQLAQGYIQPEYVMKLLYPLAEVNTYGGQIVSFDDSAYEEIDDNRADGTDYPEIEDTFFGRPFQLKTKGIKYKLPDKKRDEMANLRINWGDMAAKAVMSRAGLMHEIQAAVRATTVANYATTNRVTLSSGSQLNEASVDPDPVIRAAKSAVSGQIGVDPNVGLFGQTAFDAFATKFARNFTSTAPNGVIPQLTEDALANILGLSRVRVVKALRRVAGVRTRIMDKDIILGYTNPAALNGDRLPYRPDGVINIMQPGFGYTYVFRNHPLMYDPGRNEEKGYTFYKLDFDREIVNTGVDDSGLIISGYLIKNAVA